ncbi:MAG: hypothetical protein JSS82_00795 [Bacteroidetes bacterium]|nr:hypothetical protein [Bacteroidota bacterium]
MKRIKLILIFILTMHSVIAQPSITINNNSACTVNYSIRARDAANSACTLQSVNTNLAGGNSVSFATTADVAAAQGWQGSPTLVNPYAWQSIKFAFAAIPAGNEVGISPCTGSTTWTYSPTSCVSSGTLHVDWTVVSGNIVVNIY